MYGRCVGIDELDSSLMASISFPDFRLEWKQ